MKFFDIKPVFVICMAIVALHSQGAWSESKVFLLDGQTRQGFVHVRDGRVTIRMDERLFQHSEEAIHRIDHVTGETSLVVRDNVLLREKPERMSKTLIAVPKGCEVVILGRENEWVHVQVYGEQSKASGYLMAEDLSDSVFFRAADPTIRFQDPPLSRVRRQQMAPPRIPLGPNPLQLPVDETSFRKTGPQAFSEQNNDSVGAPSQPDAASANEDSVSPSPRSATP